jgi:hypothetical protein
MIAPSTQLRWLGFLLTLLIAGPVLGLSVATAQEQVNVGVLKVERVKYPRQVAPSARFSLVIDVEYAIRTNATAKVALFEGSRANTGVQLWNSDDTILAHGGDKLWAVNLTAPSSERPEWTLTVFAYYFQDGKWQYFTDDSQGPGFAEIKLKVASLATLQIDLGASDVQVQVDNITAKTSGLGTFALALPVGVIHGVSVPLIQQLENSTRLVFNGWQDGSNETKQALLLDGDTRIAGSYRTQYLLQVNSIVPEYSYSAWYDKGANVSLHVESSLPAGGVLRSLGLRYVFKAWSGDLGSSSPSLNLTIEKPMIVNADFTVDYTPLIIPLILLIGSVGGIVLAILGSRRTTRLTIAQEQVSEHLASSFCDGCGEPVEEDWTHCVHCGKKLPSPDSVEGGERHVPDLGNETISHDDEKGD